MKCAECGYTWGKGEPVDMEPAAFPSDYMHPNYDPEHDAVAICPRCYARETGQSDAAQRRYAAQIDYVCGIHD